jgi:hypothetical protein
MIWESGDWKEYLLKTALKLSERIRQKRWTERSFFLLERDIFFAFYSIRKLIEAKKLSDYVVETKISLQAFKSMRIPVTRFNRDRIDELYDLQNPSSESIKLKDICNQFIHSYIFVPCFGELNELDGIIFCSDHTRKHRVFKLAIADLIDALKMVGSDYPFSGLYVFDEKLGDYHVVNLSTDDPDFNAKVGKYLKKFVKIERKQPKDSLETDC